jgi:hypothetical protein
VQRICAAHLGHVHFDPQALARELDVERGYANTVIEAKR